MSGRPLPAPAVPASAYTEEYFREVAAGATEWSETAVPIHGIYAYVLTVLMDLPPGRLLVDVGCGRGELIALAAEHGVRAVGVDYAPAAVDLAKTTVAARQLEKLAEVHQGDARSLPVADAQADAVSMLDVVEHLLPAELELALAEAHRVLRPGGQLVVHTFPNRLIYDLTYRWLRRVLDGRAGRWPADPRLHWEREMHVNEQTLRGLSRAVDGAGFRERRTWYGDWVYTDFVPSRGAAQVYRLLAHIPGLKGAGRANILLTARR
ncbi:MAG TPA: class I SAM-dependent methyltransferase [Solirubrobacteraceae bacterium]